MSLASSVAALVVHVQELTTLKKVWGSPPESLSDFPAAVVYPLSGEMGSRMRDAVCDTAVHLLAVEIHHARQMLPQAVTNSLPYVDSLFDVLRASTTLHILYPITYRAGALRYGDATHYGVRFEIRVQE